MTARRIGLLDVVALTADVPGTTLVRGQVGTVVEELGDHTYEVEFVDPDTGRPYAVSTLDECVLLPLAFAPVRP